MQATANAHSLTCTYSTRRREIESERELHELLTRIWTDGAAAEYILSPVPIIIKLEISQPPRETPSSPEHTEFGYITYTSDTHLAWTDAISRRINVRVRENTLEAFASGGRVAEQTESPNELDVRHALWKTHFVQPGRFNDLRSSHLNKKNIQKKKKTIRHESEIPFDDHQKITYLTPQEGHIDDILESRIGLIDDGGSASVVLEQVAVDEMCARSPNDVDNCIDSEFKLHHQ